VELSFLQNMASPRELNYLSELMYQEAEMDANVGMELMETDAPLEHLVHADVEQLSFLDVYGFVSLSAPTPTPPLSPVAPRASGCCYTCATPPPSPPPPAVAARPCTCRRSRCLKMYCDCWGAGTACTPACSCKDCGNFSDAGAPRMKKLRGCKCKHGCTSKYCVCQVAGRPCTHACKCAGCKNCTK